MRVLLVSCYELGHQPQHLAGTAGFLAAAGHEVRACDLAVEALDPALIPWAEMIAVAVPMHTAVRIARPLLERIRDERGDSVIVVIYGLYAPMAATGLPPGLVDHAVGGEYEEELTRIAAGADSSRTVVLDRLSFPVPVRGMLPPLERYARLLQGGTERLAGHVESSRGCVHRCRHCPVPVVYDGRIRVVQVETVVADAVQQWRQGARHLTVGDPDFLNAVPHALAVARGLHAALPEVTLDVTVKVEHILEHARLWPELRELGVIFVVSAVESTSARVLGILDKGHTHGDTMRALDVLRDAGIEMRPSLLPFTPWTDLTDHLELLDFIAAEQLFESVDPVHLAIRLLLPAGSLLLAHPEMAAHLLPAAGDDGERLWRHPDPLMDSLAESTQGLVAAATDAGEDALVTHMRIRELAAAAAAERGLEWDAGLAEPPVLRGLPRLSEAWFCCAEPTGAQLRGVAAASRS